MPRQSTVSTTQRQKLDAQHRRVRAHDAGRLATSQPVPGNGPSVQRLAALQLAAETSADVQDLTSLQGLAEISPSVQRLTALQSLHEGQARKPASRLARAQAAPAASSRPDGQVVQRVGDGKMDVVTEAAPPNPQLADAYNAGQGQLSTAIQQANAARKQAKDDHWAQISGGNRKFPEGITTAYARGLSTNRLQDFLPQHAYFQQNTKQDGWRLKADWLPDAVDPPDPMTVSKEVELNLSPGDDQQPRPEVYEVPLAKFRPRQYGELANQPAEAVRRVYSGGRNATEYVEDRLGVKTRRYAYVEKNYFQMMEFLTTHHMEGRFQSLVRAKSGEERPDVRDRMGNEHHQKSGSGGQSLTDTQLAFVHQYRGSGDHQRGLSLTSTPRKGEIISNEGGNFRTAGGFRLKIDLARIADGDDAPILLNHYAAGGIKDKFESDVNPETRYGKAYKYKESVTKNRELYLEFLKPEYVVEIEYHPAADPNANGASVFTRIGAGGQLTQDQMLQGAKQVSGHDDYVLGFNAGVSGGVADPNASREWGLGWAGGNEYRLAYDAALTSRQTSRDSFGDIPALRGKDEHTIARIARIHALSGRNMITGLSELGTQAPGML